MADVKISQLPTATSVAVADLFPIVQGGVTKQATVGQIQYPRGHLWGLTLSNNVTDPTNDLNVAAGECADDSTSLLMTLGSTLTKRLDAVWAVGSGNGGLDTGSIANGTYHVWLIKRPDTGVVDTLFSTSGTSPTMPANYTLKRRIGAILREAATIVAFKQNGDHFAFDALTFSANITINSASATTHALRVPLGIKVRAEVLVECTKAGASTVLYATSLEVSDTWSANGYIAYTTASTNAWSLADTIYIWTNTSGQIRLRANTDGCTGDSLVRGWLDDRGRTF